MHQRLKSKESEKTTTEDLQYSTKVTEIKLSFYNSGSQPVGRDWIEIKLCKTSQISPTSEHTRFLEHIDICCSKLNVTLQNIPSKNTLCPDCYYMYFGHGPLDSIAYLTPLPPFWKKVWQTFIILFSHHIMAYRSTN